MASRAVLRINSAKSASNTSKLTENAKRKTTGQMDYLGELRRYNQFWDCVKAEIGIQKKKLSEHTFFDHHKEYLTNLENIKLLREKKLIHPQDSWKVMFDVIIGALILYSLIMVPYRIGFQVEVNKSIFVSDLCIDFLFFIDVMLRFNTAYVDSVTEMLVISRRKIAETYLQFWFWVDCVSSIPFDLLATGSTPWNESDQENTNFHSVRLIRILRLVRLFKIVRMLKLKRLRKHIDSLNINPGIVQLLALTMQVSFVAHLIACFWYYLTTQDVTNTLPPGPEDAETPWYQLKNQAQITWITVGKFQYSSSLDKYVASFYWVVTSMLSIGYGDIAATNNTERVYSIFTMLFGGVVFGALVAQVTQMIENQNPQLRAYKSKMDEIKAYLGEKKLPQNIRSMALEAYAYYLQRKSSFGESAILDGLPDEMVTDVVFELYYREISNISLFREASTYSEKCFVVHLVRNIKPQRAAKGETIFNSGDISQSIIFIMSGLVRMSTLVDGDLEVVLGYATKGGFFGDIEFGKRTTRLADYKAAMNCSLLAIPNDVFEAACLDYPEAGVKFKKLLARRHAAFETASKMPSIRGPRIEGDQSKKHGFSEKLLKLSRFFRAFKNSPQSPRTNDKRRSIRSMDQSSSKGMPSRLQLWIDGNLRLPSNLGDEFKVISQEDVVTYRVMYLAFPEEKDTTADDASKSFTTRGGAETLSQTNSSANVGSTSKLSSAKRSAKVTPLNSSNHDDNFDGSGSDSDNGRDGKVSKTIIADECVSVRKAEEPKIPTKQSFLKSENLSQLPSAKGAPKKSVKKTRKSAPMPEIVYSEASAVFFASKKLLHPLGQVKNVWDAFIGVLIIYSVIFIPIQIGFGLQYSLSSSMATLAGLDIFIDISFLCDIIISFHTSYYSEEHDAYVLIPSEVRKNYFKTWFLIDFFSTVPFDDLVTALLNQASTSLSSIRLVKVVRIARLLKLARVMKLGKYIARLENSLGISPAVFDLTKLLCEVCFIGHIFCCCWWALSESMTSNSWIDVPDNIYSLKGESPRDSDFATKYFTSLYVTFTTLTTVGYGDIVANNTSERFINMFIELVGATVFGYMVASVSSLIGVMNRSEERIRERLSEVTEYLNEKNCPPNLSNAVIRHYRHKFSNVSAFDEAEILDRLPQNIAVDILMHNHANHIKLISIFAHISNPSVCAYIFGMMTPSFYDVDQVISQQGEQASEIVFLIRGQAMVVRDNTIFKKGGQSSNAEAESKKKLFKGAPKVSKVKKNAAKVDNGSDSDRSYQSVSDSDSAEYTDESAAGSDTDDESKNANDGKKRKLSWSSFSLPNLSNSSHTGTSHNAAHRIPSNHWQSDSTNPTDNVSRGVVKPHIATKGIQATPLKLSKESVNLGMINEGDFVGYAAMMENHGINSASIIATRPCSVYGLRKTAIHRILREHPPIGALLQSALGKCIENIRDELGRHHMINNRGEFLQNVKQRFKRETTFCHNIKKLLQESELEVDHAESVLSKATHLAPNSPALLSKGHRDKRVMLTQKEALERVDEVLNQASFFYDSEEEESLQSDAHKSARRRMTEILVNKVPVSLSGLNLAASSKNERATSKLSASSYKDLQNALLAHAKKKGVIKRHRSVDDLLQFTAVSHHFSKVSRTAVVNPFKIPLYHVPHKNSRDFQLLSTEAIEQRVVDTAVKNAKLKLSRRQSFPSLNNQFWKEEYVQRGVI